MQEFKIETNLPPKKDGVYVAYTEHPMGVDFPYPEKQLFTYINGKWHYTGSDQTFRGKVYAYIGPLPQPTVKTLLKANMSFAIGEYYMGGRPDGDIGFTNGPFDTVKEALECFGSDGKYIFKLNDKDSSVKESYKWLNDNWVKS